MTVFRWRHDRQPHLCRKEFDLLCGHREGDVDFRRGGAFGNLNRFDRSDIGAFAAASALPLKGDVAQNLDHIRVAPECQRGVRHMIRWDVLVPEEFGPGILGTLDT